MRSVSVRTAEGTVLVTRGTLAERWWQRLLGLLGRRALEAGDGLLLLPCRAVHMMGMRFPVDVALLDRAGRVVATHERLAPGLATAGHRDAWAALELPAGTLRRAGVTRGTTLVWEAIT